MPTPLVKFVLDNNGTTSTIYAPSTAAIADAVIGQGESSFEIITQDTTLQTSLNALNAELIANARNAILNAPRRLYLQFAADGSTYYQTEIFSGGVEWDSRQWTLYQEASHQKARVTVQHRPYFDSLSTAAVTCSNLASTGGTTGALAVANQISGTNDIRVSAPALTTFDELAPTKITITNAASTGCQTAWIFGVRDYAYSEFAVQVNSGSLTFTGSGTTEQSVWPTANPTAYVNSRAAVPMLHTTAAIAVANMQARVVMYTGADVLHVGQWTTLQQTQWNELPVMPFPPNAYTGTHSTLLVTVQMRRADASDKGTVVIDKAFLMPVDFYRRLRTISPAATVSGGKIIDDGYAGVPYVVNASVASISGAVFAVGNPIRLDRNRKHCFFVLHQFSDGTAPLTNTVTWQLEYRARFNTV